MNSACQWCNSNSVANELLFTELLEAVAVRAVMCDLNNSWPRCSVGFSELWNTQKMSLINILTYQLSNLYKRVTYAPMGASYSS